MAGLATGFWESREEIDAKWKLARRYDPQMSEEEREQLHRRWLNAVERSRGWEREKQEAEQA
jgi:glycerol kinase